jgi:DNA-binding transcriptional LysR family regulator
MNNILQQTLATAMIDVSEIRMIKMITELGSINRAAEILHMSQPTLSKKLSRLEDKIGLALFIRNSSGMVATPAAKRLLLEGQDIESRLINVERHLALMANKVGGQIRIGVGPVVEQLIVPDVLLAFAQKQHQFRIVITTESPSELIEQLSSSQIDIAIGPFNPLQLGDEFTAVLTKSEPLVAIVRAKHPLAGQSAVSHEHLKQFRFISPTMPQKMCNEMFELQRSAEINPHIVCDNYTMAKTVIANSDYITIGPESLFSKELQEGNLAKIELPTNVLWRCNCLAKPETLSTPAVKEVVNIFAQFMTPTK